MNVFIFIKDLSETICILANFLFFFIKTKFTFYVIYKKIIMLEILTNSLIGIN